MAIKANLVIDQGTDFSAAVNIEDEDGNVFALAGYEARAQMRKNYASSTATDFDATIDSQVDGQINLSMNNSVTSALEPGRYLYDVEIDSATGTVTRVVEGIVTVTPGITRF